MTRSQSSNATSTWCTVRGLRRSFRNSLLSLLLLSTSLYDVFHPLHWINLKCSWISPLPADSIITVLRSRSKKLTGLIPHFWEFRELWLSWPDNWQTIYCQERIYRARGTRLWTISRAASLLLGYKILENHRPDSPMFLANDFKGLVLLFEERYKPRFV